MAGVSVRQIRDVRVKMRVRLVITCLIAMTISVKVKRTSVLLARKKIANVSPAVQ